MIGGVRESDSSDAEASLVAQSDVVRIARWLEQTRAANRLLREADVKAVFVVADAVSDVGVLPFGRA